MKQVRSKKNVERRNYFRIDDFAILQYRPVSDEELRQGRHEHDQVLIEKLTLKARFDSISREMLPLFRQIEAASPEIAQYLSSIDRKLNLLSEYYVEMAMGDMDSSPQRVNLGAGGVSFKSSSPLLSGSLLELRIVLLPEHYGVFSYARVVNCVRVSEDDGAKHSYKVSVEYENMSDDVRDIITRHVLNKEQRSISKARTK